MSGALNRTGGAIGARNGIRHVAAENETLSGKFIYSVADNLRLTAVGRYSTVDADTTPQAFPFPATPQYGLTYDRLPTDPTVQVANEYSSRSLYGLLRGDLELMGGAWTHSLTVQGVFGERKSYDDVRTLDGDAYGTRQKASYATTVNFATGAAMNSLTFAADFKRETYRNKPVGGPPTAINNKRALDNVGLVGQYDGRIGDAFGFGAALRYDDNTHFKDATTYRVQASYRVLPEATLRAAAGSGVTNPTNTELFGFDPSTFIGNPNLKPERSEGWEVGLDLFPLDGVMLGATYFNNELTDEIFTTFGGPPLFLLSVANRTTKSTEEGVELWASARLGSQWRIDAAWTNLHALESSPALQEIRRPPNVASLNVAWRAPEDRFGANVTIRYNSEQRDLQFTPLATLRVPLKAVTLVNLGADYRLSETWQIYGRVENLLDTHYEEVFAFPAPGRAFYAGVRMNMP
jgi:vitamin B12 transporter